MKKFLLIAVSILAFYGAKSIVSAFFSTSAATQKKISVEEARDLFVNSEVSPLFSTIEREFPAEYIVFIDEFVDLVNNRSISDQQVREAAFENGSAFTTKLRVQNSNFIVQASIEHQLAIQRANLRLLQEIQNDKYLCARYSAFGAAGLTFADREKLPLKLVSEVAVETFEAIADGRRNPVNHPSPSDEDFEFLFVSWIERPETEPNYLNTLIEGDASDPDLCDASLSFQEFIVNEDNPRVRIVLPELTRASLELEQ